MNNAHRQAFERALAFLRQRFERDSEQGRKVYRTDQKRWRQLMDRSHEVGSLIGVMNSLLLLADRCATNGEELNLNFYEPKDDDLLVLEVENQKLRAQLDKMAEAVWVNVASTKAPFRQCFRCRGIDPNANPQGFTNVGHSADCPFGAA